VTVFLRSLLRSNAMKVKLIKIDKSYKEWYGKDDITLGKIYECTLITRSGMTLIVDDVGQNSALMEGEYEVVEE
jgi:hypothetical protein